MMYETRDVNLLQDTLSYYNCLIMNPNLHKLCQLSPMELRCSNATIQALHIKSLSDNPNYIRFSYILNALSSLQQTIGVLLISSNASFSIYILIKGNCPFALSLLESGLRQSFPGCITQSIDKPSDFLSSLFNPHCYSCLTSALTVPNDTYDTLLLKDFTELIGQKSKYVALFLAEPTYKSDLRTSLNKFYDMCNTLSNFSLANYTYYKSEAKSNSNSCAECNTNASGASNTNTSGQSHMCSQNSYTNVSVSTPITLITTKGAHNKPLIPSTSTNQLANKEKCTADNTNNTLKNLNTTLLFNKAKGTSNTSTTSNAHAQTCNESKSNTSTHSHSATNTLYQAQSFGCPNKYVQDAIEALHIAITRYKLLSQSGAYHFSSYFFSPSSEISYNMAYTYLGLAQSSYPLSPNVVNSWFSHDAYYPLIFDYLRQLSSPSFYLSDYKYQLSNSVPILNSELINTIYLPIT